MPVTTWIKKILFSPKETNPARAYDIWAMGYDNQPGNLMLDLDEAVFSGLLADTDITGKAVADIGCGTGRHWKKIFSRNPNHLVGYDVSSGMLGKLEEKFPAAETHLLENNRLSASADHSFDLIVSTLTVAHIQDLDEALKEWDRVLKPGGSVIITDYHPAALAKGGKRTFKHKGKTWAVKNYIHPIEKIRQFTRQLGWTEMRFVERVIDDSVKGYYERQNALSLFEEYTDIPIIYGILLIKADDPA
jgi:ubiquinone/menaquinone biosynthesis C-methylase UbiE